MISADITILRRALVESVLEEHKDIPAEAEIEYTFSSAFQQRIEKLIRRSNTRAWYCINSPLKKAIIIAILIGLLTITAAAVPAIREALIDFFVVEREPGVYGITFDPEQAATAPHQIETFYGPTDIPEGYYIIIDDRAISGLCMVWMDDAGNMIYYDQCFIPQNALYSNWMGVNAEGTTRESKIVEEYLVEIFFMEESYTIYWTDNHYVYSVTLSNTIPFEVFENLLASMTVLEE